MRFKDYITWVSEDFSAVGVAPAGNVNGMGPVVGPNSGSIGSGDTWDNVTKPAESTPAKKICPVCKKKKCICDEED